MKGAVTRLVGVSGPYYMRACVRTMYKATLCHISEVQTVPFNKKIGTSAFYIQETKIC